MEKSVPADDYNLGTGACRAKRITLQTGIRHEEFSPEISTEDSQDCRSLQPCLSGCNLSLNNFIVTHPHTHTGPVCPQLHSVGGKTVLCELVISKEKEALRNDDYINIEIISCNII